MKNWLLITALLLFIAPFSANAEPDIGYEDEYESDEDYTGVPYQEYINGHFNNEFIDPYADNSNAYHDNEFGEAAEKPRKNKWITKEKPKQSSVFKRDKRGNLVID